MRLFKPVASSVRSTANVSVSWLGSLSENVAHKKIMKNEGDEIGNGYGSYNISGNYWFWLKLSFVFFN